MLLALTALATAGDADPKIINGEDAAREDFPATGALLLNVEVEFNGQGGSARMFICSSTLIAPDVVATAAHCLDEEVLNQSFTYGYGTTVITDVAWSRNPDQTDFTEPQQGGSWPDDAVTAWDWAVHPGFDIYGLGMGLADNKDIALVFLDEPVTDVDFVYLGTEDELAAFGVDSEVTVVGYGQQVATSGWESPPAGSYGVKQQGVSYVAEINDYEFKVGELEADVRKCHGDSGGPSYWESDNGLRLVGITSHAYDSTDCNETGGVDTRVQHYFSWIDTEMSSRCEDGARVWCDEAGIPDPGLTEEPVDTGDTGSEPPDEGRFSRLTSCSTVPGPVGLGLVLVGALFARRRRKQD